MFTLTINGNDYDLSFGMKFVRDINEKVKAPVDGVPGLFEKRGLNYAIGRIIDKDIEGLVEVLLTASKAADGKLKQPEIDAHLEREDTDVDELFETVLDFFVKSNCTAIQTKKLQEAYREAMEEERRKKEAMISTKSAQ